jgi:UDPglucose 6-dehydrogenase
VICEQVGADAKEVERGLKSESRIGPKAYLGPGGAFAGGTLARDVAFLTQLGEHYDVPVQLFPAIKSSNDAHKNWARRRLIQLLGDLKGKTVAVWGLTYKPGTDTLRRSSAVELCTWLLEQGVTVQAHDPAVKKLPDELKQVQMAVSALDAVQKADALVVATEWLEYREVDMKVVVSSMKTPYVLDVNRFLAKNVDALPAIKYVAVGKTVK